MNRRVYLDHNASTPVHPEVVAAMLPYFGERFGNPSSIHGFGREAREGVDQAREQIAEFLGAGREELVFVSGGTEADNLAVKGVAGARGSGHIITSAIEHHAVLRTCQQLERQGFTATYLPVDATGLVDPDDLARALRDDTILVSIMHGNSEIGTVQPLREIGRITRERGVPLHTDAVQTFGKLPIDLDGMGIDLLSFSGHKIYGPKGIGGLYIRKGTRMASIQHGGEHERRRRAGTENVPAIVGLGAAVALRARVMADEAVQVSAARDRFWAGLQAAIPEIRLNGHPTRRLPGTCNVCVRNVESESIVLGLDLKGIATSAGSACTSGSVEPSHVIAAIGVPLDWAMGTVRCSLGRSTTVEDVDHVVEAFGELAGRLRTLLPARS